MDPPEKRIRFERLYAPQHERFERFCKARAYGEMEYGDLMNETVLRVLERIDRLKDEKAFLAFLFTTARRVLASDHRKMRPLRLDADMDTVDEKQRPDSRVDIGYLYKAIERLPEKQGECILLFEIGGYSIKEIMDIQNAGESAVKQRLRRARIALAESLTESVTK